MKDLVLRKSDNSVFVEYKTDLIDGCRQLTIYQVRNKNNNDTEKAIPFGIDEYHIQELIQYAVDNAYLLEVYETGASVVTLVGPYGAEAIGEGDL